MKNERTTNRSERSLSPTVTGGIECVGGAVGWGTEARMADEQMFLWQEAAGPRERGDASADRARLVEIHRRLCDAYGCPVPYFSASDPLSMLISSLLSHRTRNADTARAMAGLRERFADWTALRDAPTREVEAVIAAVTWPELKAPRLQAALREITRRVGGLTLDFLADWPVEKARAWLESLPGAGVGRKTSASVISYSYLRGKALPVDSHHHRVAARLALIPQRTSLEKAHALLEAALPPEWDAQTVYDHHQVIMKHGKRCCFPRPREPDCPRCPLLDLCPTGQAKLGQATRP